MNDLLYAFGAAAAITCISSTAHAAGYASAGDGAEGDGGLMRPVSSMVRKALFCRPSSKP